MKDFFACYTELRQATFCRDIIAIVGTTYYKNNLLYICKGKTNHTPDKMYLTEIALESDNKNDKTAVKISIGDNTVGHLSREYAKLFRETLTQKDIKGSTFNCYAKITGGWRTKDGFTGSLGVRLDLPEDFIHFAQLPPDDYDTYNFSFGLEHIDKLEIHECRADHTVRFWEKPLATKQIYVYKSGSCGGGGYLGKVPISHYKLLKNHLDSNLPIHAHISKSKDYPEISCTLFSKKNIQNKLRNDITKKYRPRKGFCFSIYASPKHPLKSGEKLYLKHQDINFYIENATQFRMQFVNSNGLEIGEKTYPDQHAIKILRAQHNGYNTNPTVTDPRQNDTQTEQTSISICHINATFSQL